MNEIVAGENTFNGEKETHLELLIYVKISGIAPDLLNLVML